MPKKTKKKRIIRFRWSKIIVPLLSSCLMVMACEDETEEVEEAAAPGAEEVDEVEPVQEVDPGEPARQLDGINPPGQ